ncbi:hypothetical protein E2C01_025288 [Portunus trituberculatus]|uniref:Uncharacterized protein n=1 Tax=Portunus trituberculatus TaxID=210409 RepID=A0A5B7EFL0_PORTR|nr:hypothetical protein [Portunus trituberculatus]
MYTLIPNPGTSLSLCTRFLTLALLPCYLVAGGCEVMVTDTRRGGSGMHVFVTKRCGEGVGLAGLAMWRTFGFILCQELLQGLHNSQLRTYTAIDLFVLSVLGVMILEGLL